MVQNLAKDPRRDMKLHICVDLIKRVPLFKYMNEPLLDVICQWLKLRLYMDNSYIILEGDPVDEILFITRGRVESATTNRFFNSGFLKEGDFCGDELLIWAFDHEYASLPSSITTMKALRDVEAFALPANELKFIIFNFKGIHRRRVHHTLQFYSIKWRTWAACFIQAAWRRYYTRKIFLEQWAEEEAELTTHNNAGGVGRTSYSLGNQKMLMNLRKPPYSNFNDHINQ